VINMTATGTKRSMAMLAMITLVMMFAIQAQAGNTFRPSQFQNPNMQKPIIKKPVPANQINRLNKQQNLLPQCSTSDPALTHIHIAEVSTNGEKPGFYTVTIQGAIVNAGNRIFLFNQHTVWLRIQEDHGRYFQEKSFTSGQIEPGQQRQFSFHLSHVSTSIDFIPDYIISIRTGSRNPAAIDCRPQNNRHILTRATISHAINAHLRRSMQISRVRACVRPGRGTVIDGHNFGNSSNRRAVMFGERQGQVLTWTDRQLIVRAPASLDPNLPLLLTIHATNNPSSPVMAHFGIRTCPSRPAAVSSTPADFKFGTMTSPADGSHARGVRPLLVVLAANGPRGSRPRLAHNAAYYDQKIFGPGYPNVADFYKVNSYFQTYTARGGHGLTWRKAAIIGPIITQFQQSSTTRQRLPFIKRLAASNGFDFSRYDRNRDGRVTASELGILIIDNFTSGSGQTVPYESCTSVSIPRTRRMINVCTGGSFVGHDSNVATMTHELSHLLGTIDIYGTGCLSGGLSLMTCTGYDGPLPNPKLGEIFLLDPWHRSRLGWLKPRIYSITNAGSALLRAPSELYGKSYNAGPLILYDPRRGTQEYFILEFRERQYFRTSHESRPYGYDANAPESGVAVWHVKTDGSGNLLQIPDRIPDSRNGKCAAYGVTRRIPGIGLSCGNVNSVVVISPSGHGRLLRGGFGGRALWKPSDGGFSLKWLNSRNDADGSDLGIRLRIYGEGKGYARVRWDPHR